MNDVVANGPTAMQEDRPVYLSTRRDNYRADNGGAIAGTESSSGGGTYDGVTCTAA